MANRDRKILLLGCTGYERHKEGIRVDCHAWDDLRNAGNIRDYDIVVVDLLSIHTEPGDVSLESAHLRPVLNLQNAMEILLYGGCIVVLGDPRFQIAGDAGSPEELAEEAGEEFLSWTGLEFAWDSQPGDTVEFQNDYDHRPYSEYVKYLSKWDYSLRGCRPINEVISSFFDTKGLEKRGERVSIERDFYCRTRYGNALAFTVRYCVEKRQRDAFREDRWETVRAWGPIEFLPPISLDDDETMQIVLRDICGVQAELPEPEWLSDYNAPGQAHADEHIEEIRQRMDALHVEYQQAQADRAEARECLKLLYEREYALEPAVRDILRGLGAEIEEPEVENKEDGWLAVNVAGELLEAVLEIKSTKNDQFSEDGRKQLLDWIDRGRTLRNKQYKGLFIGNSAVTRPPTDRPDPFSSSWKKAAELSSICAMTTVDLYCAHSLRKAGKLDWAEFWKAVFATCGVFDIAAFLPQGNSND